MPLFRTLTRLLLIASLVLNGSGYAPAAMGATSQVEAHARTVVEAVNGADADPRHAVAPCHEGALDRADTEVPAAPDPTPDCCDAGGCLHACHQQPTPAACAVAFVPAARVQEARAIGSLATAHEAPAPHPLIRPPIA